MADLQYYDSNYYGEQVDEAIGRILKGEVREYAERAETAANNSEASKKQSSNNANRAETAANRAEFATVNTPYIGSDGNWMIYDQSFGEYINSGNSSKGQKGDKGDKGDVGPIGPQGPKGDPGKNGVVIDLEPGLFVMEVNEEGHLIIYVNENEDFPPFSINDSGHLIYSIS